MYSQLRISLLLGCFGVLLTPFCQSVQMLANVLSGQASGRLEQMLLHDLPALFQIGVLVAGRGCKGAGDGVIHLSRSLQRTNAGRTCASDWSDIFWTVTVADHRPE